jgi:hypothetical protein
VSKEKSQFENVTMPTAEGGAAKKNTAPALPADFSVGQNLEKEQPVPRAESVKSFMPSHQSQTDRAIQEEKEFRMRMEKEGMNYDLYLLIKEGLASEFEENFWKSRGRDFHVSYDILKQTSLPEYIQEDPELYTPNPKDLIFITKNLKELFTDQEIKEKYSDRLGMFVNSFIHAYFNSVPQEKRKDLKLYLPNTKDLTFIGSGLSFGELEVDEAGDQFGRGACGEAVLKARKADNYVGFGMHGNAQMEIGEVKSFFGQSARGEAFLKAQNVGDFAGSDMHGNARMELETAGDFPGSQAYENAEIKIIKECGLSAKQKDNAKVIFV